MLVLTRKINEEIVVRTPDGTEIIIAVVGISGSGYRIGIKAAENVSINRSEIQKKIDEADAAQEQYERRLARRIALGLPELRGPILPEGRPQ